MQPNSTNRGETIDNDQKVLVNTFTKESRIQLYILQVCGIILLIHLSCFEQDIPAKYKEA